jgi:hypothetical protein
LIVEVVAVKEGLHRIPSQHECVLLELLIILILPVLIDVLLIEVVLSWWDEGSLNLPIPEILPGEVLQPRVVLDL